MIVDYLAKRMKVTFKNRLGKYGSFPQHLYTDKTTSGLPCIEKARSLVITMLAVQGSRLRSHESATAQSRDGNIH
jgi:hypothetical protein